MFLLQYINMGYQQSINHEPGDTMNTKIRDILESRLSADIYQFGFADVRGLLDKKFERFTHAISIIRKLDDRIIDAIGDGPVIEYYDHYNAVNSELNILVEQMSLEMRFTGKSFMPICATVSQENLDESYKSTLTYAFSHKMAATRAGLGWIGKTDLLVSERFGPRVRLATILTDMDLDCTMQPITESRCGNCSLCVDICPAKAASGQLWNVTTGRDTFFDAFKCMEYCRKISREKLDEDISLCGKCIYICPKGKTQS